MSLTSLYNKLKLYRIYKNAREHNEVMSQPPFWIDVYETIWRVEEIRNMLKGYKTYIIAALTAVVTILHTLGYIDEQSFQNLLGLLGAGAIGTVAAKINRMNLPK